MNETNIDNQNQFNLPKETIINKFIEPNKSSNEQNKSNTSNNYKEQINLVN